MDGPSTKNQGLRTNRLLIATTNRHKVAEITRLLSGLDIDLVTLDLWPALAPPDETATTFDANARDKAIYYAHATDELTVAEDSGLEIDALGGAPGIHSARWAVEGDWIPRVLRELADVATAQRGCRYVCAAAAVWPDGREIVVRGTVAGTVAEAPRGTGGFGYDPIMIPVEGDGRTFAELPAAEKHRLSHRGRAFRILAEHLASPPG